MRRAVKGVLVLLLGAAFLQSKAPKVLVMEPGEGKKLQVESQERRRLEQLKSELSKRMDAAIGRRDDVAAERCLEEAWRQWLDITVVTFSPLIDQAAQQGNLQRAEWWFENALLFADKLDEVEFNSLVAAAANQGNLTAAEAWFSKACEARVRPDAITLTSVLRAADPERAKDWYRAAPHLRISPNEVTDSCLLHALRSNATEVSKYFEAEEFRPNAVMFNTVINALARAGNMKAAEDYFQRLCHTGRPDVATFGALINGAAQCGDVQGAKAWMEQMDRFAIPRNVIVWNAFLKVFRHQPKQAEESFKEMVQSGQQPDAITLVSLIGFLGKPRVKELCGELAVDYDRIIRETVVNRDVKRMGLHAQQSKQYRRLSRFSMRTNKAQIPTPWYRLLLRDGTSNGQTSR